MWKALHRVTSSLASLKPLLLQVCLSACRRDGAHTALPWLSAPVLSALIRKLGDETYLPAPHSSDLAVFAAVMVNGHLVSVFSGAEFDCSHLLRTKRISP